MIIPVVLVTAVTEHAVQPQHMVPKNKAVSIGGRSGPPLRRGFEIEHVVNPIIENQVKIRQARADTAALPYAEDL